MLTWSVPIGTSPARGRRAATTGGGGVADDGDRPTGRATEFRGDLAGLVGVGSGEDENPGRGEVAGR